MTIKVYISGISGSQEVRKQQQRVLFILQSLPIDLKVIDITEPGRDEDLVVMQEEAKKHDKKTQLPPQIFNGNDYCGDYADFEMANDDDEIMKFLKLEEGPLKAETLNNAEPPGDSISQNGINHHNDKEVSDILEDVSNEINDSNSISNDPDNNLSNTEISAEIKEADKEIDKSNIGVTDDNVEISNDAPPEEKQPKESAEESEEEESE